MKKCFTINQNRTKEEFASYEILFEKNIYQAMEIFYPYMNGVKQLKDYTDCVYHIMEKYPSVEIVLHLPHGLYNGLCLDEHLNSGSLEIMKAGARFAHQFGVKKLTLHLGKVDETVDRQVYVDKIIPILQDLCDFVKPFNQNIMIENMPTSSELGYGPEEILEIIKRTNRDNLKFIFDCGHAHVSCYDDTSYIYLLKDYLYHLHYSDNDSTRDAHAEMGTGTIDFAKQFKALDEIGYHELHCMEVIYHDVNDLLKYVKDFNKYE